MSGMSSGVPTNYEVELPAGGKLHLLTMDEVELFEKSRDRYLHDFKLTAQSDLLAVSNMLVLTVESFRAAQRVNGMEAELDASNVPTGRYVSTKVSGQDRSSALSIMMKTRESIAETEKQLGIDKRTRDQGGQHDVDAYVQACKSAAREFVVHLSRRYKAYDEFVMTLRTQVRMLKTLDNEDLMLMGLSKDSLIDWIWNELSGLEAVDKKYANEKHRLFIGKIR